ncbi:MAG TPA: DUF302 domain-containing protein [Thermoanaerobaculia bacterium]|nr:DUF302 domain-containing protein [Thermoanaerobaculia bacterium]
MQSHTTRVSYEAATDQDFESIVDRCRDELAREGFGVLTEIDVQATLKKKLDVDREPYLILGACQPQSAHRALTAAPEVGVLLPCNVTVSRENGQTVVRAMNPEVALGMLDDPEVEAVACEVGAALRRVLQAVTRPPA